MGGGVFGCDVQHSGGSSVGSPSKTGHYSCGHDRAAWGRDAYKHCSTSGLGNGEDLTSQRDPDLRRPKHYGGAISNSRPLGAEWQQHAKQHDTTVPEGELPLTPVVTPGWGVAGAILIVTGAVYTLIGIKNTWLHVFGSVAYLSSLCTTVLIIYVMVLPVSNAIQGAYVVAVVCTGVLLGGGSTVFRDLTESLGCLLGGFCFSMWLLSLHDGGLLQDNTSGKVVFIIVFTLAGFAMYFSQYTRAYSLMALMSFTGATVMVLGIDCFSRAGLKEFWAWIWDLNSSLFPLGATTYPITRGMRVELALTVIFCAIGIISQLRLWKVIQERRAKRAADRAEARRQMDEEEANLGRQVEAENARERREWEATYGQRNTKSPSISQDSGVGDVGEKPGRIDDSINKEVPGETVIELAELPESLSGTSAKTRRSWTRYKGAEQRYDTGGTRRISRQRR
ncbi:hypothetical protein PG994_011691 [Apiospora phragmitis]|uniref:TM7S3/TM198-like domain-containing protein n=1 Tax=Apiospora phragmitis TaxID=2905665 RepID=A0ABR1TTH8_9PEZI